MHTAALYVHVPFCRAICAYCDFARQVCVAGDVARYLVALDLEFARAARELGERLAPRTVFLGGGTPTSLESGDLSSLLALIARHADLSHIVEFTVEANPGTLAADTFAVLRKHRVNRISFGVQSFQPRLLQLLGRIHSAEQARRAVLEARDAGFENVSIDLMHGLPSETRGELAGDLAAAIDAAPSHISAYGLSYEEGTPLAERVERGELKRLDPGEEADQYRFVMERLGSAGYRQYEISNYARERYEARHNLVYWHNGPYLGVGPSAASYIGGERRVNRRRLEDWAVALEQNVDPVETRERLEGERRAREALMLALRLREGASPQVFRERYGFDIDVACAEQLRRFEAQKMMERTAEGHWRITRAGLPVADAILSQMI
jgi:oxygen-independent coproporphyrinogen-3 oxidase